MAATPEAASVPLPEVDDTIYHTSPAPSSPQMKAMFDDSTPQTVRPTPSSRRQPLSGVFSSAHPTPSAFNPFDVESEETPRPRRSKRGGGKYHPGMRPAETPRVREATPDSVIHHSPQPSSGTESDAGSEKHWESEETGEEEEYESEEELDDMDQTIGLPMETPMGRRQVAGFPRSSHRHTRSSPGRTPAKMLLGRDNDFTANFTANFTREAHTPRPTDFENTAIPPSLFADIQKTPFLSAASPHKLNSMPGIANNPFLMETPKLAPTDRDAFMQYQDTPGQSLEAFVDFSPEKRKSEGAMDDPQLTIKKRRSPRKHSVSNTPRTTSRNFKSPVKAFTGMFEDMSGAPPPVTVTAEEKKAVRRRRETQEFREFSAIDLEQLKGYLPSHGVSEIAEEETTEEQAEETAQTDAEVVVDQMQEDEPSNPPQKIEDVDAPEPIVTEEDEEAAKAENKAMSVSEATPAQEEAPLQIAQKPTSRPSLVVPPTPAPAIRSRVRRSSSCPPVPQPAEGGLDMRKPTLTTAALMDIDSAISSLHNRIAQLEDQLETTTVRLDKTEKRLQAERRTRIAAQETCEFLELERKFGVCCKHAPGGQTREEKLGAAAIQLPGSPASSVTHSVYSQTHDDDRRRPASRFGNRPGSRLGDRPLSRIAGVARPASRLGGPRNDSKAVPAAAGGINAKKRVRDDPVGGIIGRKPQVPRQDKRVLSAGMAASAAANAANIPVKNTATSGGLAKKPEKVGGIARMAANRNVSGGAAAKSALARGARR